MKLVVEIELEDQSDLDDCLNGKGWDIGAIEQKLHFRKCDFAVKYKKFQCGSCKTMWYDHHVAYVCCAV